MMLTEGITRLTSDANELTKLNINQNLLYCQSLLFYFYLILLSLLKLLQSKVSVFLIFSNKERGQEPASRLIPMDVDDNDNIFTYL